VTSSTNELFAKLKAAGLNDDDDAKHVMYAIANKCQFFVTTDENDLFPKKAALEAVCPAIRILKPSEFISHMQSL
jgi:predicted nucleic acid-binding protein